MEVTILKLAYKDLELGDYVDTKVYSTPSLALEAVEAAKKVSNSYISLVSYDFNVYEVQDSLTSESVDAEPAKIRRVVEIEATRANLDKDPLHSITYTLPRVRKAFPGQIFEFKKMYEVEYEDGRKILFRRNTDRFYSGKLGEGYLDMDFVPYGVTSSGVVHRIVSIKLVEE